MPIVNGGSATSGGAGSLAAIADILLAATTASLDFTPIPGTYRHLRIVCSCRGTTAAVSTGVHLTFNNDTAAHYAYQNQSANSATVSANSADAQAFIQVMECAAATAPAGYVGTGEIVIPDYASSTFFKTAVCTSYMRRGTTAQSFVESDSGLWESAVAVTRVTLTPAAGSFAAGTRATLYGMA